MESMGGCRQDAPDLDENDGETGIVEGVRASEPVRVLLTGMHDAGVSQDDG